MTLDLALVEVLACPGCKQPLTYHREPEHLTCAPCRLRFQVTDGIPILLLDEATPLTDK